MKTYEVYNMFGYSLGIYQGTIQTILLYLYHSGRLEVNTQKFLRFKPI
jgi:hypothetical protein